MMDLQRPLPPGRPSPFGHAAVRAAALVRRSLRSGIGREPVAPYVTVIDWPMAGSPAVVRPVMRESSHHALCHGRRLTGVQEVVAAETPISGGSRSRTSRR